MAELDHKKTLLERLAELSAIDERFEPQFDLLPRSVEISMEPAPSLTASAEKLAKVAIDAASKATVDHASENLVTAQLKTRSEAWFSSYIGVAINDALRKQFQVARDHGVYVTFETRVDWIDEHAGGKLANELTAARSSTLPFGTMTITLPV